MSDLDFVINKLESDLKKRGLYFPKNKDKLVINNYMEEKNEKRPIINNQNIQLRDNYNNINNINVNHNYDIEQINLYIENYITKYLIEISTNLKKINSRIIVLEEDSLKKEDKINI